MEHEDLLLLCSPAAILSHINSGMLSMATLATLCCWPWVAREGGGALKSFHGLQACNMVTATITAYTAVYGCLKPTQCGDLTGGTLRGGRKQTTATQINRFGGRRATCASVAPGLHVCLKSSFPSLTVFFLSFREALGRGACQTQPASPYNLPCYSANTVLFCSSHWSE
jgi:hypothetical protein